MKWMPGIFIFKTTSNLLFLINIHSYLSYWTSSGGKGHFMLICRVLVLLFLACFLNKKLRNRRWHRSTAHCSGSCSMRFRPGQLDDHTVQYCALGRRQAVRHGTLVPACGGSNPPAPAHGSSKKMAKIKPGFRHFLYFLQLSKPMETDGVR